MIPSVVGWELESCGAANLADVRSQAARQSKNSDGSAPPIVIDDLRAVKELWNRLELREIEAFAWKVHANEWIEVPHFEWSKLEQLREQREGHVGSTELGWAPAYQPTYRNIGFTRPAVTKMWSAIEALVNQAPIHPLPTTVKRPEAGPALVEYMRQAFEFAEAKQIPTLTRDESTILFSQIFSGTSRAAVRKAMKSPNSPFPPPKSGRRGKMNPNRDEEIEKFRQFLSAAERQN